MKLYADEHGHEEIRALRLLIVSVLARVEVLAAIWRKHRTGELAVADAAVLAQAFAADWRPVPPAEARFVALAITEALVEEAASLVAPHGLRAYDAIQLATARAARRADPACTGFACFDEQLRAAAAREGFALIPG